MSLEIKQEPFTLELYAIAIHYAMLSAMGTRAPAFVLLVSALATAKLLEHAGYSWVWKTKFVQHCHAQFCEMKLENYLGLLVHAFILHCFYISGFLTRIYLLIFISMQEALSSTTLPIKGYVNPRKIDITRLHQYAPWVQQTIRKEIQNTKTHHALRIGGALYQFRRDYFLPLNFWREAFKGRSQIESEMRARREWDEAAEGPNKDDFVPYKVAQLLGV